MDVSSTSTLPIAAYRDRILESVDANQVTIITAETGAGKSTQVPQYLAEHGYQKVVVTQPRILAARNLSLRVREEWAWRHPEDPASHIAYRTAQERDDDEQTTVLYCTDGLQLVREVTGGGTAERQVLVLDEIHEWNQNMEVLVAWAKKRCLEEPLFKVVVMSATIDSASLAAYFGAGVPIEVPGRGYAISRRQGDDLVEEVKRQLWSYRRNVLVFLPGKSEIESVAARLREAAELRGVPVIPLHSQLSAEAQQLAFASYPNGKIVLSTNIAQTSVTIEDVDAVVDSGLERRSEVENGVEGLIIGQASRSDCLQRAGRSGRTKAGEYVLAPLDRLPCDSLEDRPVYGIPEILRTLLDRVVLRLASADIDIEQLRFFHPPDPDAIRNAKQTLLNLGAMTIAGGVTELGHLMEAFPVESRYSRMLVEARDQPERLRRILAAVIAIQEVGGIVRGGTRSMGWLQFTDQKRSDLLAQYEVYLAALTLPAEDLENLGIIEKNLEKAKETFGRLVRDLGLGEEEPEPFLPEDEDALMGCIVAGQVDQIWIVEEGAVVAPLAGGFKRELSSSSVVVRAGLLAGTPFNLEVPTPRGVETLFLVQDVTAVDPRWLASANPDTYAVQPGAIYFDSRRGALSRRWSVMADGLPVKGASTAITEATDENRRLFWELCGAWLHERLEQDRKRIQKESGKRLPPVPVQQVQERVRGCVHGALSLDELRPEQRQNLERLATMRAYGGPGPRRGKKGRSAHRHKH